MVLIKSAPWNALGHIVLKNGEDGFPTTTLPSAPTGLCSLGTIVRATNKKDGFPTTTLPSAPTGLRSLGTKAGMTGGAGTTILLLLDIYGTHPKGRGTQSALIHTLSDVAEVVGVAVLFVIVVVIAMDRF